MRYHLSTAIDGEGLDLSLVTTVTRVFLPGERPKGERPACFSPAAPPDTSGLFGHDEEDTEVDSLATLVADGSVRLAPDVFLTEAEASELARGKVPSRLAQTS